MRYDFAAAVRSIRDLANRPGFTVDDVLKAVNDTEHELAYSSLAFLYDVLYRRNQFVAAAELLARCVPMALSGDMRVKALLVHALTEAGARDTAAREIVEAKIGTLQLADAWAREKTEMLPRTAYWLWAVRMTRSQVALEYGCGSALNVLHAAQWEGACQWIGVDVSEAQIRFNQEQADRLGVRARFVQTPNENYYSLANCVAVLHVLEHTAYPEETLDAAETYLGEGGVVVLVVPTANGRAAPAPALDSALPHGVTSHVSCMTLPDLMALASRRGRLLDARVVLCPGAAEDDACVVYAKEP